jgi:hypothetical protein
MWQKEGNLELKLSSHKKLLIRTKSINLAGSEKCLLFCSYLFFNLSDESICSVVSDPAGREVRLKIDDFG